MNNNLIDRSEQNYSSEELANLANNIFKKIAQQNLTLPELAKKIGVEYQTLWRIAYQKEGYMPSLRVLFPIADFFAVTIADLLKNPNLPQYVPLIQLHQVEKHLLEGDMTSVERNQKVFCSEYIHEKAFAIELTTQHLETLMPIRYVFKPYDKIINDGYMLLQIKNDLRMVFAKLSFIQQTDLVKAVNLIDSTTNTFSVSEIYILALAVKQMVDYDLI